MTEANIFLLIVQLSSVLIGNICTFWRCSERGPFSWANSSKRGMKTVFNYEKVHTKHVFFYVGVSSFGWLVGWCVGVLVLGHVNPCWFIHYQSQSFLSSIDMVSSNYSYLIIIYNNHLFTHRYIISTISIKCKSPAHNYVASSIPI